MLACVCCLFVNVCVCVLFMCRLCSFVSSSLFVIVDRYCCFRVVFCQLCVVFELLIVVSRRVVIFVLFSCFNLFHCSVCVELF